MVNKEDIGHTFTKYQRQRAKRNLSNPHDCEQGQNTLITSPDGIHAQYQDD